MTLIGPDRDVLAFGAALNEQGVRVCMTAPGGAPRRCVVKISRSLKPSEAAAQIITRLHRSGLLGLGDVVRMQTPVWCCQVEVATTPSVACTGFF
jgi:hypothetical protein